MAGGLGASKENNNLENNDRTFPEKPRLPFVASRHFTMPPRTNAKKAKAEANAEDKANAEIQAEADDTMPSFDVDESVAAAVLAHVSSPRDRLALACVSSVWKNAVTSEGAWGTCDLVLDGELGKRLTDERFGRLLSYCGDVKHLEVCDAPAAAYCEPCRKKANIIFGTCFECFGVWCSDCAYDKDGPNLNCCFGKGGCYKTMCGPCGEKTNQFYPFCSDCNEQWCSDCDPGVEFYPPYSDSRPRPLCPTCAETQFSRY